MDDSIFKQLTELMSDFLKTYDFKIDSESRSFKNEKKSVIINYNELKNLIELDIAEVSEGGEIGEYKTVSNWMYDSENFKNDAQIIASDFCETISKYSGITKSRFANLTDVALPSKAAAGQTPNLEAFTQKFLTIFPQYKDVYKAHISEHGEFLYVDFFKATAVVKMRELLANKQANRKQLEKFFSMLGEMYCEADATVINVISAVIITGAFCDNPDDFAECEKYLKNCPYLVLASRNILKKYAKSKKFREVFNK
ncbi:MAG: hypothetical protein Q4B04_05175 [bacterium]|nr:hypothetical protein [bacterium]